MKNLSELETLQYDAELSLLHWTEADAKFHIDNFNELMPNKFLFLIFDAIREELPLTLVDPSPYVRYVAQHYASRMME